MRKMILPLSGLWAILLAHTVQAQLSSSQFTITQTGGVIQSNTADDTPSNSFIDKDGSYYYQSSHSLYGATDSRTWSFFSGTNMDTATMDSVLSNYVNPSNSLDSNGNTTWRCNNSPTGNTATFAPSRSSYAQANYCDLTGVWIDPDNGNWIGLVHNEFTPEPFGDGLHYDAIDQAYSTDQGKTWTITDHVITTPYSTQRQDNTTFPEQTYYYGDGDPRLTVDIASGYFYMFYGSRVVNKGGSGGNWVAFYAHVARAPMSGKMLRGTWQKWYNGAWSEPGVGGKESNIVPVDQQSTGYTPAGSEYQPSTSGTAQAQISNGQAPPTSPLFVTDATWNSYLGLWIAEPQIVDQTGNASQEYYATDDLTTQKWTSIGNSGSYHTASWYRWLLDPVTKTSSTIVGKAFRAYCAYGCSKYDSEYITLQITSSRQTPSPVNANKKYRIIAGQRQLSVSGNTVTSVATGSSNADTWTFNATGDGSYSVTHVPTGKLLGVSTAQPSTRAWGTTPSLLTASSSPDSGLSWWIIQSRSTSNTLTGSVVLINRYSGMALALSSHTSRLAETAPVRSWNDTGGNPVGGGRTSVEQLITLVSA